MRDWRLVLICILFFQFSFAQNSDGLIAHYSFNSGKFENDLNVLQPKAVGVSLVKDRFGNENSACYLFGNRGSYLNLGTDSLLKPVSASISVWVKMKTEVYSGNGYEANPVVLTKSQPGNDFFEGYSIVYSLKNKKFNVCNAESDMNQIIVYSDDPVSLDKWYHIVMTYDDHFLSMYINGKLEQRVNKNFRSHFLQGDSVMIGATANVKNNRFFMGAVDDLRIYNRVIDAEEVLELYNEADPNWWHLLIKWALFVFVLGIAVWGIVSIASYRLKKEIRKQKEQNRIQSQMYEMEMKVIKAQMNPHFIFNSMNSIQQFILEDDTKNANAYLVKFSRLLRKILESNTDEMISVENEIDILEKYLEIESLRFQQSFHFKIERDEKLAGSSCLIPQMLVQPIVENAIWHGLLPKNGNKEITVKFEYILPNLLKCTVEDNGIGRTVKEPTETVQTRKSLGIQFIRQRLELMGKESGDEYCIMISDKKDVAGKSCGTLVTILMPLKTRS